jgi:metacaspase-1
MPRRRALLIGINYTGTSHALNGCINDVDNMCKILTKCNYTDLTILKDDESCDKAHQPTRRNIIQKMKEFVTKTRAGDLLFFHFSGHGTQTWDRNGDEKDRKDEAICPVVGALITDDEIRSILINRLPGRVQLMMLLDCCHSGTGADLRYSYEDTSSYIPGGELPSKYIPTEWKHHHRRYENQRSQACGALVICISGCQDRQTSADTWSGSEYCGAMSMTFIEAWNKLKSKRSNVANLTELVQHMTCSLRCFRYTQRPQIAFSSRVSSNAYSRGSAILFL